MSRRFAAVACALLVLAARVATAAEPTVILLSFDGTRPDVASRLPVFQRIAREGAWADALVPAFPSNTFPNHVTFATGVSPDRHGIVNNTFRDPARGLYDYDADPTWLESEPIWSIAARAGVPSASFHWVGSEGVWTSGLGPRHWERFDAAVPTERKVAQILAWLDLADPAERPRLVTAWFHGADGTSHRLGPDAPEVATSLARQDRDLAALLEGIAQRGLLPTTTVLVVSDHGMTSVRRAIDLGAAMDEQGADVIGGGGFATVALRGDRDREERLLRAAEAARALGLEAWRTGAGPPEYAITNPRFGDLVVVAPLGVQLSSRTWSERLLARVGVRGFELRGVHGHRPELPEMAGLFAAIGRDVAPGARVGTVRAIDVAPTVLALLGIPIPAQMEGRPIPLAAAEGAKP